MERPIQLIDMPEDSMRHILERCDFVSIQCLRKTCHTLRNFIDETKPKPSMKVLEVLESVNYVCLIICEDDTLHNVLYPVGSRIELYYEQSSSEHTTITWNRSDGSREKTIKKRDHLTVFSEDLLTVLGCKQSKWDKILVNGEAELLEKVKDIFLSLKSQSKVHTLVIDSDHCKKPILAILSSVCSETLTYLKLYSNQKWNMSKMKKLEHWKKVKESHMERVEVRADIENYLHFESAKVYFTRVKVKDLLKVKEIFLNTQSITKYLEIFVNIFPDPEYLERIFGECYILGDGMDAYRHWFFKRPDEMVVGMELSGYLRIFCFSIITLEDVPENAIF